MEEKLMKKFKDSLTDLRITIKELEKLRNNTRLKVKVIKDIAKKELKEIKINKLMN